jgi:hypothetical protein
MYSKEGFMIEYNRELNEINDQTLNEKLGKIIQLLYRPALLPNKVLRDFLDKMKLISHEKKSKNTDVGWVLFLAIKKINNIETTSDMCEMFETLDIFDNIFINCVIYSDYGRCWRYHTQCVCDVFIKNRNRLPLKEIFESFKTAEKKSKTEWRHIYYNFNKHVSLKNVKLLLDREEWTKYIENSEEYINYVFENNFENMAFALIEKGKKLKKQYIDYCIRSNNKKLLDKLLQVLKASYTINHKYLACRYASVEVVKDILNQGMKPDSECVEKIFEGFSDLLEIEQRKSSYQRQRRIYDDCYKEEYFEDCNKRLQLRKDIKEKIELLINYGYSVTQSDILTLFKQKITIDQKYVPKEFLSDNTFIEKILEESYKNNIYPYGIKHNRTGLLILIKDKKNFCIIEKYIKDSGITPDMKCLKEACKHGKNLQLISTMVNKYGLKPDIECVFNCIDDTLRANAQIKFIANKIRGIEEKSSAKKKKEEELDKEESDEEESDEEESDDE